MKKKVFNRVRRAIATNIRKGKTRIKKSFQHPREAPIFRNRLFHPICIYQIFFVPLRPFSDSSRETPDMTTNTHILTINTQLGELRELVRTLTDSAVKEKMLGLMASMTDEIFSAQTDFASLGTQVAELSKQLYAPVVHAQMGEICRYIDIDALNKVGTYSLEVFDKMLRQACASTAKELGAFLRKYEKIGYLDFHQESKKKILEHLQACYPTMRPYKYKNFAACF